MKIEVLKRRKRNIEVITLDDDDEEEVDGNDKKKESMESEQQKGENSWEATAYAKAVQQNSLPFHRLPMNGYFLPSIESIIFHDRRFGLLRSGEYLRGTQMNIFTCTEDLYMEIFKASRDELEYWIPDRKARSIIYNTLSVITSIGIKHLRKNSTHAMYMKIMTECSIFDAVEYFDFSTDWSNAFWRCLPDWQEFNQFLSTISGRETMTQHQFREYAVALVLIFSRISVDLLRIMMYRHVLDPSKPGQFWSEN